MHPVKVVRVDTHSIITGSDRVRAEAAIAALVRQGARLIDSVKPLGNNWIATCEDALPASGPRVVTTERIGLRTFVRGTTREAVEAKIEELCTFGAAIVVPLTADDDAWIAVIDERAKQPRR